MPSSPRVKAEPSSPGLPFAMDPLPSTTSRSSHRPRGSVSRTPLACLSCRKCKLRCVSSSGSDTCQRCIAHGLPCVFEPRPDPQQIMTERMNALSERLEQIVTYLHGAGPLPPLNPPDTPPTPSMSAPAPNVIEASPPTPALSVGSDWPGSSTFTSTSSSFGEPIALPSVPLPFDTSHDALHMYQQYGAGPPDLSLSSMTLRPGSTAPLSASAPPSFDSTWSLPALGGSGGYYYNAGTDYAAHQFSPAFVSPTGSYRGSHSRASRSPVPMPRSFM